MKECIIGLIVVNIVVIFVLLSLCVTYIINILYNNHLAKENKRLKSYIAFREKCDSDVFDRKFYFDDRGDLHSKK